MTSTIETTATDAAKPREHDEVHENEMDGYTPPRAKIEAMEATLQALTD